MMRKNIITLALLGILLFNGVALVGAAPTATTDKSLYYVGETITISGTGGTANGIVLVQVSTGGGVVWVVQDTFTSGGAYTASFKISSNMNVGAYTVIVKDDTAKTTATTSFEVITSTPPPTPTNAAPTASISGPSEGKINEAVSFNGVGTDTDGTIVSYAWTFGDGGSALGSSVSHTYITAGTYTVTLTVTDNGGKTGTATVSLRIFNPPPSVDEIKQDTPEAAAAKLEETLSTEAAAILEELPPQTAADIIELLTVEKAVDILVVANVTSAAQIVEKLPVATAVSIVESAVTGDNLAEISDILIEMNDQDAARVLVDVAPASAAEVIQAMATQNLNDAARTVEDAVELFINELDPTTKEEVRKKVKAALENVTVDSLVQLFIEIANLPNTPSTVAAIFETMDLSKVLNVITGMGAKNAWLELGNVFGYLTQGTLGTIYTSMPSAQRQAIFPYLSAQTVALLPKLGTYTVSNLQITPAAVASGASVTVTVAVANTGTEAGTHDVILKVNGATEQTKTVSLNAGGSTTVSFTVTESAAGTYTVAVETLTGSFKVEAPAAFAYSNLSVTPAEATPGAAVAVSVTVKNNGDQSGTYSVELKLDGASKETKTGTLAGGASATVTFTVSSAAEGTHTVAVGTLSGSFKVTTPPPPAPDYTWYIVGGVVVVLAIVAVYFLFLRKK